MKVKYTPSFLRKYKKLPIALQEEVEEKIILFSKNLKHPSLKAHKLKGKLEGIYSFSVNYAYRILFLYEDKKTVKLLGIGTHKVYE
ncbi:type II toxin-antitoxin system mRNA interferase toxin, RelE/StbE family [Patescibacteria group bacterium]|nr:type II toxin-antitoxin system mRNA interferase toxin, RelE/StbE family [Patescibacteria group bacterium]MBU1015816.1 type II toxin-antitoxin system mRNA interferase toxin, RelE/StbE family [Patescibacteria group bacterium]MBU1685235.1 type II toxin-antitoxin system mRNA interferase toxin, RelE/StbE family [Patescibacteria group bacterium]MBU1938244.1 type II toxin-antitoxin system mRNA interferase toxin, RelE/StbE family [Patescibacteria group bacterium]